MTIIYLLVCDGSIKTGQTNGENTTVMCVKFSLPMEWSILIHQRLVTHLATKKKSQVQGIYREIQRMYLKSHAEALKKDVSLSTGNFLRKRWAQGGVLQVEEVFLYILYYLKGRSSYIVQLEAITFSYTQNLGKSFFLLALPSAFII